MRLSITLLVLLLAAISAGVSADVGYQHLEFATGGGIWAASVAPDGSYMLTAGDSGRITLWKTSDGSKIRELEGHKGGVRSAVFSPEGLIVSGGWDKTVRFWDPKTGELKKTLTDTQDCFFPSFSRDGKSLVTASSATEASVWDPATGKLRFRLIGHKDAAWTAAFSPDGKLIATGSADKTVRLWDASTGKCLRILRGHTDSVTGVTFTTDSKRVASCGNDGTVRVWDAVTGTCVMVLYSQPGGTQDLAVSPDGLALVSVGGGDGEAKIWDLRTGELAAVIHEGNQCLGFSSNGRWLATGTDHGYAFLWDWKRLSKVVAAGNNRRDLRQEYFRYGLAHPTKVNPSTAATITENLKTFAVSKRAGRAVSPAEVEGNKPSLKQHFIDPPQGGPRPNDGYISKIKKVIDSGYPVGSTVGHTVELVAYVDDPYQDGGGLFVCVDPPSQCYRTLAYEYVRTHMGGFTWWE